VIHNTESLEVVENDDLDSDMDSEANQTGIRNYEV
jgi:hypothetical protein